MKALTRTMALVLCMISIILFASPVSLYAGSLDDLSNGSSTNNNSGSKNSGSGRGSDSAVSDYLSGYTPVTDENMQNSGLYVSLIVNLLGTLAGGIIMLASAGIFVVTALDLMYIGLPFTRSFLEPQYQAGGGAGGGMGMGGMGMGGMGGMQGGAAGGGAEYGFHRRWVSDEAVNCVAANASPQGGAAGGMGGGMGMGGMGMGGMGMGGGAQKPQPIKSVITEYLKKRSFFIVVFAVAAILLTSSVLTDSGINVASLIVKILNKINGSVGNINV